RVPQGRREETSRPALMRAPHIGRQLDVRRARKRRVSVVRSNAIHITHEHDVREHVRRIGRPHVAEATSLRKREEDAEDAAGSYVEIADVATAKGALIL